MNEQNNNGRFFNNIPNDPNMNNGNNFDTNTGQPINNMNSVPMGAPMEQQPALVNGFASQPMNNVPTMVPNPQQQPTAMPMKFDTNTGQPINNMNSVPTGAPMEQQPALVNGFTSQPMNNVPTTVPNPQQQPTAMPMKFDTNTGQPINNMNSAQMGAPMEQQPALVNGFASQPMNNVPTTVPNPQQQSTAMPMNFDPNTGQPLPAGSGAMFDPNTGMPITPGFVSNNNTKKSNKKVFAIIGCVVALIGIFCLLFVRVITCESEQEQYGVTMTTKITALSVFGDIKTMEFKMEVDLSELDEDDREYMIELIEGSYGGDEDTKIDVKKDKIIIEMEGFKKEEAGELDKDDLEDMFSSIDLTCK